VFVGINAAGGKNRLHPFKTRSRKRTGKAGASGPLP
jgi:hypothetical protein